MNQISSQAQSQCADLQGFNLKKSNSQSPLKPSINCSEQYLTHILKCPICQNKVIGAHMCPFCCKLFCELCIKNLVASKCPNCPNCNRNIRYASLINCSVLGQQIEDAICNSTSGIAQKEELEKSTCNNEPKQIYSQLELLTPIKANLPGPQCQEHCLPLEYYCETCSQGICSDCAVLTDNHRNHRLCKLSKKRVAFKEAYDKLKKMIEKMLVSVAKIKESKLQILQRMPIIRNQKTSILINYLKRVNETICFNLDTQLAAKEGHRQMVNSKVILLEGSYEALCQQLSLESKSELVLRYEDHQKTILDCMRSQPKQECLNLQKVNKKAIPEYESKVFILDNYSHLRKKREILYSEPFFWKGIEWKLKIYPGGLEKEQERSSEQYLAIYLEMSKGHIGHSNIYKYKIELVNQIDRSRLISRTFESEFEESLCWGYDSFSKISTLYDEKYVHPVHDYLQIVLHVKSPTFYHAVKDQSHQINHKLQLYQENLTRIRCLRKKAGKGCIKQTDIDLSSLSIRAIIDQSQSKLSLKRVLSNPCVSQIQI